MPRIKVSDIRDAVKVMILKLNGIDPYATLIPDATHFYAAYSQAMNTEEDKDYPKVVLSLDGGEDKDAISRSMEQKCSLDVIFIFKQIPNSVWDILVEDQVMAFIDDIQRLRFNNRTLSGLVRELSVKDWTTDSGFDHPEGVVWLKLVAEYKNQM